MAVIRITTKTLDEYRIAAQEFGVRMAYLLNKPRTRVVRVDITGRINSGKSTFQENMAQPMLFNTPVIRPAETEKEWMYSFYATSRKGQQRQAIFVDCMGITHKVWKVPKRTHKGPLFVQHTQNDHLISEENLRAMNAPHAANVDIHYRHHQRIVDIEVFAKHFPTRAFLRTLSNEGIQAKLIT